MPPLFGSEMTDALTIVIPAVVTITGAWIAKRFDARAKVLESKAADCEADRTSLRAKVEYLLSLVLPGTGRQPPEEPKQ